MAARRVADSVHWGGRFDTLTYAVDAHEPPPAPVVNAARRCAVAFDVARVDPTSLAAMRDLALAAGDDSAAVRAVARQLAVARQEPDTVRAAILLSAIQACVDTRPVRIELARRFVTHLDSLGPLASAQRWAGHSLLIQLYVGDLQDPAAISRELETVVQITDRVPPALLAGRGREEWDYRRLVSRLGLVQMTGIREGPAAELAELEARGWRDSSDMLGRTAPRFTSPFVLAAGDSAPRPRRGKLSMVVFTDNECACGAQFATLKRIMSRHPELEITLVAQTRGYFRTHAPPSVAEEAELNRQLLKDFYGLPGAVVVDTTLYDRVSDPDHRRVNHLPRDYQSWRLDDTFGVSLAGRNSEYYLVAPSGIVAFRNVVNPATERLIEAQLAALARETGNTTAGGRSPTP